MALRSKLLLLLLLLLLRGQHGQHLLQRASAQHRRMQRACRTELRQHAQRMHAQRRHCIAQQPNSRR